MTLPKTIGSKFAALDVTTSRHKLKRHFADGAKPIPVIIKGFITGPWSSYDSGCFRFDVDVTSVEIFPDKVLAVAKRIADLMDKETSK